MTFGKAFALTTGFAGAFALGVLVGPSMTNGWRYSPSDVSAVSAPAAPAPAETPAPAAPRARVNAPRASMDRAETAGAAASTAAVIPASTPELQQRLKRVLRSGAKMDVAADGFKSAEQFATVAHASQNTDVPFMLLKHRVVDEGKSVEAAIRESKPDLDAKAAVTRARDQAREDVAALNNSGN